MTDHGKSNSKHGMGPKPPKHGPTKEKATKKLQRSQASRQGK